MKWTTALLAIGLTTSAFASEIDSFTGRFDPPKDELQKVNEKANELLQKGIDIANEMYGNCDEKKLYKVLRKRFRNKYTDEFSNWAYQTPELERVVTPVEKSVYRDWKWYQAPVPGGWARMVKDPSASLLNIGGVLIGDDKFEHFFGSGFAYFKKNYLKENGLSEALKHGWSAETGYMGATTTGVMAYGDLSANFNGMRFWNHVLQKREDIMGQNIGPYVSCEAGRWQVNTENPIDLSNYIDDSMDEGINCSAFNGPKLITKIKARLRELSMDSGKTFSCPMDMNKLKKVWKKYGRLAPYLINVQGHIDKPKMSFEEYLILTPEKVEAKTGFRP